MAISIAPFLRRLHLATVASGGFSTSQAHAQLTGMGIKIEEDDLLQSLRGAGFVFDADADVWTHDATTAAREREAMLRHLGALDAGARNLLEQIEAGPERVTKTVIADLRVACRAARSFLKSNTSSPLGVTPG